MPDRNSPSTALLSVASERLDDTYALAPEREEELLTRAGFQKSRLFYCGLWIY